MTEVKRSINDAWRILYSYAVGGVELLENGVVNICERVRPVKVDDSNYSSINGKVCIVTGANAGVGLVTAKLLAERGGHVVMACRSRERAMKAADSVRRVTVRDGCSAPKVEVMEIDLASLRSVNDFCDSFEKKKLPVSLLVCNAGIMDPPKKIETEDGMEAQFQVNYLGHWLLANRLLSNHLRKKMSEDVRVVMVTSMAHIAGKIDFDDIHAKESYHGFLRYADSKLANVVGANELQRRLDRQKNSSCVCSTVSVHPGVVDTFLARQYFDGLSPAFLHPVTKPLNNFAVFPFILRNVSHGGASVLAACLSPSSDVAGKYMAFGKVVKCGKVATSPRLAARLWGLSERLCGVKEEDVL